MGVVTVRAIGAPEVDGLPTMPSEILAAWRAAERRYARATPGTEVATALHAEMRALMDEYEWRVRGGIPRNEPGRGRPRGPS